MISVIDLKGVTKIYDGKPAVKDINLQIEQGSVVSILGPNGAGKTTMISMMLGLIKPTTGSVQLLGNCPSERTSKQQIGALLQENTVIDCLKVNEIIEMFRSYYDQPLSTERLLQLSGLEKEAKKMATSLSGGQKRRLGFAQAMAGNPSILFLDEPTVGMDVQSRKLFWETVKSLTKEGKTIILTTHYLEEADQISDRIIVMKEGRMIADGSPEILKENVTKKFVSFKAGQGVTKGLLEKMLHVDQVEWGDEKVRMYSKNTDSVLFQLFHNHLEISDIEVQKGKLDEAFEFLTNEQNEKVS